ncbi:hypothetical protein AGMMS49992_23230 [Clostridia bacterium]|nr:hypothetical protein AGMMS49992_23230 [Clostridia bacterium]
MNVEILTPEDWIASKRLTAYSFRDNSGEFTDWCYASRAARVFALRDELRGIGAQAIDARIGVSCRGQSLPCSIISHVSTDPAHRRKGLMNHLLPGMLQRLADERVPLAALYPSAYSFYTRYGFAACGNIAKVTIPLDRLRGKPLTYELRWDVTLTELHADDSSGLRALESCYRMAFAGVAGIADSPLFNLMDLTNDGASIALLYSNETIMGYWTWKNDSGTILIDTCAFRSAAARLDFLSYLASHASTIAEARIRLPAYEPLLRMFPDRYAVITIEPWAMFRAVSLPNLANSLNAGTGSVTLRILDGQIPDNDGVWRFESNNGKLHISRADGNPSCTLDIGAITQWLLGSADGAALMDVGYSIPPDTARAMDALLPAQRVFLWEQY